jgi:hypothetical protein
MRVQRVTVVERWTIPPKHEAVIQVRSDAKGPCLVTTMGLRRVSVTNGIHQLEGSTFFSKVANFSAHAVTLTPGNWTRGATFGY